MLDLRRARSTSLRTLPEDWRRMSSLWMPAFMVAAAASECGGVWEVGGDCDMGMGRVGVGSFAEERAWRGVDEGEGEGGSELRSGGMVEADGAGRGS